jgi:hypothetical protein
MSRVEPISAAFRSIRSLISCSVIEPYTCVSRLPSRLRFGPWMTSTRDLTLFHTSILIPLCMFSFNIYHNSPCLPSSALSIGAADGDSGDP